MGTLPPYQFVLAGPAVVPVALTPPACRIRWRGGALAAYEEAFRATGHDACHEIRQRAGRKAPTGSPGPGKP
ncbi:hypothetical protein ABZ642_32015 [Streptomyces sp. NPDC007157]|uniref:hypothetical protein n=1 Tax=Streptomyces sp. NPDC007157 TaxID=3154681 RepID=UPI0033DE1744